MDLDKLMQFARAYRDLGWAIQEQADDIAIGEYDDINPNALSEIDGKLRGYDDDLDAAIDQALEAVTTVEIE
jgi:hypothetical protein